MALKFYNKIVSAPDKLTFDALQSEIDMDKNGRTTWATFIKKIVHSDSVGPQITADEVNIPQTRQKLNTNYQNSFFDIVKCDHGVSKSSGNKLRTYALLKQDYSLEPYLESDLPSHLIRAIARLRTSSHSLAIETGRYCRPRLPPEQRLCKLCDKNHVEDEKHFLLDCPAYSLFREQLYKSIPDISGILDVNDKFVSMMTSKDHDTIKALAKFIAKAFTYRKESLKFAEQNRQ